MIEVNHLTKKYGSHVAVSDLSFKIEKGQIYGFLGPNGAGKSTTMNIMTGCLAATEGEVKIGGYDIFEDGTKAKKLIGYLPEQPPLYMDRTPKEYLRFVAMAKGVPASEITDRIVDVMEETGITHMANRLIKNLSKGYRQRVGIAQALLGDPEVIILDEPTVGLDPRQIIEIRELIRHLGESHTVILSSHILSEVQAVCNTILIISNGRLVACDTPDNLEKMFEGTATAELTVDTAEENAKSILAGVSGIDTLTAEPLSGGKSKVSISALPDIGSDELMRNVFFAFSKAGTAILSMTTAKASLEDIFIELTGETQADVAQAAVSAVSGNEDKEADVK